MRLAALLLAAVLPVQASACLTDIPGPEGLRGPCRGAGQAAPLAVPDEPPASPLRPRARPDQIASGGMVPSLDPPVAEDPLLSPSATLFWDVV